MFTGIVQERLRYVPLGWAKYYEFNESDLRVACDTLDTWIDSTAMVRFFTSLTYNSLLYTWKYIKTMNLNAFTVNF